MGRLAVERFRSSQLVTEAGFVGLLTFALLMVVTHTMRFFGGVEYVALADAFVHGHVWVSTAGHYAGITDFDVLPYKGKAYVIEAPMPAILLMPLTALRGPGPNAGSQELLACILAAIAMGAAWRIATYFNIPRMGRVDLCGALLLGSGLLWCCGVTWVWNLAHVCSFAFTLLALSELLHGRRAWLVGIYAGCAFESRFPLALAVPVYAMFFMMEPSRAECARKLRGFVAGFAPFALMWVSYNMVRWGLPYDIGYQTYHDTLEKALRPGPIMRLSFLPYQIYEFFMRPPELVVNYSEIRAPFLAYDGHGIALTYAFPALALAFWARRERLSTLLWTGGILAAIPSLLYYTDGVINAELRHGLDFEPFLFVLMASAMRGRMPRWASALCLISMLCGVWMLWYWNTYAGMKAPIGNAI
jgi:hypothetical protein